MAYSIPYGHKIIPSGHSTTRCVTDRIIVVVSTSGFEDPLRLIVDGLFGGSLSVTMDFLISAVSW